MDFAGWMAFDRLEPLAGPDVEEMYIRAVMAIRAALGVETQREMLEIRATRRGKRRKFPTVAEQKAEFAKRRKERRK